jgi:hypothetical protein
MSPVLIASYSVGSGMYFAEAAQQIEGSSGRRTWRDSRSNQGSKPFLVNRSSGEAFGPSDLIRQLLSWGCRTASGGLGKSRRFGHLQISSVSLPYGFAGNLTKSGRHLPTKAKQAALSCFGVPWEGGVALNLENVQPTSRQPSP